MMLKIGEKIKQLREKKNITQNKMAEYLGITEQAISRWENGGGYPDMEMIPAISNFLDISIDELFETDRKAERLNNLKREAGKNSGWDNNSIHKRIEMFCNILKEFPNDYETMFSLAVALSHDTKNPHGSHSKKIIALNTKIINDCLDINLRRMAVCSLAQEYKNTGKQEKAVQTIKESDIIHSLNNGIGFSRERILSDVADGEEMWVNRRNMLQHLCNYLCIYIYHFNIADYLENKDKSNEEFLEMLKKQIIIYEKIDKIMGIFYEDGDYGYERESMVYYYNALAEYYIILGEYDKALDNIEKCAETAMLFDTDKAGTHTSILVKNLKKDGNYALTNYGNHSQDIKYNQSYRLIHDWFLSEEAQILVPIGEKREKKSYYELLTPIRETERFKAVISKLKQYAKAEKSE